jgi:hypothetical protein
MDLIFGESDFGRIPTNSLRSNGVGAIEKLATFWKAEK